MFDFSQKARTALILLIAAVLSGAAINYSESLKQNSSKLPTGLERDGKFVKWINKWKERFPQIESDNFKKVDDGEIFSSTNPRYMFTSLPEETVREEVQKVKGDKYSMISPGKTQYLSFKKFMTEEKTPESSYVYYYGIRDGKTISGPIYECKKTKCYYDRPFFVGDDKFYLPEIQEKVYPENLDQCKVQGICSYELFLHKFDLKANDRTTFVNTQLLTDFKEVTEALDDL